MTMTVMEISKRFFFSVWYINPVFFLFADEYGGK